MGIDEVGIDEVGIDKVGIDKVGITRPRLPITPPLLMKVRAVWEPTGATHNMKIFRLLESW